jgi:formylglycine-generating enzyme required for sulfatase activity
VVGKYPVTNLQYQRFLESEDYDKDYIWKAVVAYDADGRPQTNLGNEAWTWFQQASKEGKRVPSYWDDARLGAIRRLFPVVGVTWYEAAAYCAWLTRHWRDYRTDPSLPDNLIFRLPLEAEWVAAAGGEANDRYPWQKTPEEVTAETIVLYANTTESGLGGTSPVCMYPAGMSLANIMDMAGNVWEWQANLYEKGRDWRAVRGGSWRYNLGYAPVAVRYASHPASDWGHYGFRVVGAVPVSR